MKLVSINTPKGPAVAFYVNGKIYPYAELASILGVLAPFSMKDLLEGEEKAMNEARKMELNIIEGKIDFVGLEWNAVNMLAPVPQPSSEPR
jgi:hypothetical protein